MNISPLIDRMIAAGLPPGEAGSIAAEIYAAGVASASVRSPGAERTRRWRHKASQNVTECHGDEASPNVTERHKASQSDVSSVSYRDTSISKKVSRQNSASRGSRIDPTWTPSDADRLVARQEGFSESETSREALRFLDYWTSRAGAGGVKLDWAATWRNWVRTSAEKLGKAPSPSNSAANVGNIDWDAVLKTYKAIGHWSKWAGPDPDSPACRAPPELLVKYGLSSVGEPLSAPPAMRRMQ